MTRTFISSTHPTVTEQNTLRDTRGIVTMPQVLICFPNPLPHPKSDVAFFASSPERLKDGLVSCKGADSRGTFKLETVGLGLIPPTTHFPEQATRSSGGLVVCYEGEGKPRADGGQCGGEESLVPS